MSVLAKHLGFTSSNLEEEFQILHANRNAKLETQFHYARAITWGVVLLRTLAAREWQASAIIAIGTITTALPAFAPRLLGSEYIRWRVHIQVFDNLLQVGLGCFTHNYIYPNPKTGDPSTFQIVTVLLTGNGVAWQLFCSLWGSLPFRVALPQQAAITITLLLFNRRLCQANTGIKYAYARLAQRLEQRLRRVTPLALLQAYQHLAASIAASRSCSAAVLAAPSSAAEAVRAACMQHAIANATAAAAATATGAAAEGGLHAAAGTVTDMLASGTELCLRYQPVSLLLLGFVAPTLYIWVTELRMRCAFFKQHSEGHRRGLPPRPSTSTSAATVGAGAGAAAHQHSPDNLLDSLPSLADYLSFCIPAVAAMYVYIVAQG